MFNKPFKVKSNSQLKASERKRFFLDVLKSFPQLTAEELQNVIPNKEVIITMKVQTHGGQIVLVYCVLKDPLVFEIEKVMFPTVYMLWKFPNLLHTFTTWPDVLPRVLGGADLMLPGIVLKNGAHINAYGKLSKGDRIAVNMTTNKAPFAVGKAALSSYDMYMSGRHGKAVEILHFVGDELWSIGTRVTLPELGPPVENESNDETLAVVENNTRTLREAESYENVVLESSRVGASDENSGAISLEDDRVDKAVDALADTVAGQSLSEEAGLDEDAVAEGEKQVDEQDQMDNLLTYCFMKALKTTAKNADFPLLTSNFFKVHMIPACPEGKSLDIKKSSYKKLTKFLAAMQEKQLVAVKEQTKGVMTITSVNHAHPLLREFVVAEPPPSDGQPKLTVKPEITEMYVATAAVVPLLSQFLVKKGDNLQVPTIRKYITEYVKLKNLQDPGNRKMVRLDDVLHTCLGAAPEAQGVSWEDLIAGVLARMTHSYQMTAGQTKVTAKGKLEPVDIQVGKRTGNKKVTLVNNLELYGVNLQEFARECQHGVAASTSISAVPGRKSAQLLVQGNQVTFVANLLMGKYEIPKRYIRGLENAPKTKK
ncbi:eukaryotic translation initiation factor 2D [Bacillus rossius redtenbacheri]|uniref:eukaryotic translation initiation factor 2D n=1 Tax=Bacillus rossius redtenbacheri TaxID=93214 RepID=UPI002FDEBA43